MIRYLLANIRFRRRRMALTILGIVVGTTLIMSLLLVSDGLERAVTGQLRSFGSDLIVVFPGKEENPFIGLAGNLRLRDKDVDAVARVEGVRFAVAMNSRSMQVESEGEEKAVLVHGSAWEPTRHIFEESKGLGLAEGAWPDDDRTASAVLGSDLAARRFDWPIAVGDELVIRGRTFAVAGILKPTGSSEDDGLLYVSMQRFRALTGETGANSILAKIEVGADAEEVAERIRRALERQKGIEDFVVLTPANALRIVVGVLGVVRFILGSIAAVALVVGGVNIMNTMFTAVLERTREIGVLKALGGTDRAVLVLFLAEAGAFGAIGGSLGAALAYGIGELVEAAAEAKGYPFLQVSLDPLVLFGVLALTFVLGAFFGAVPAWQAARLKPTDALRYE
jgi:putative ABC transport system permease protein